MELRLTRFSVYGLYDSQGACRYVGMTNNLAKRTYQHLAGVGKTSKDEWCRNTIAEGGKIEVKTLIEYSTREEAKKAETELIHTLSPDLNVRRLPAEQSDKTPLGVLLFLREIAAKGGQARARNLTPEQLSEIGRKAGSAPKRPRGKKNADTMP